MAIHTQMLQRAGTVRRVVRHGSVFICGLCRRPYSAEEEAHDCLQTCWSDLLNLDPVLVRKSGLKMHYRCRFCARDHQDHRLAVICAQACQRQQIDAFAAEEELYVAGEGPDARPRRLVSKKPLLRTVTVAPRVKPAPKPAPAPAPVAAAAPAQVAAAPAPAAPAAAAAPAAEADAAGGKKYKDADVFSRDGARYICKVCKKKHFTREDVVLCYEAHLAEGAPS